jgi:hypothetical protein
MKITFKCEHIDGEVITFEVAPETTDAYGLLKDFERFVACCDIPFEGHFDIVSYDSDEEGWEDESEEQEDEPKKEVWDWTVNELIKNAERNQAKSNDFFDYASCPICNIETELMRHEECFDKYCPKNENADKR